jgi:hypothetical protein
MRLAVKIFGTLMFLICGGAFFFQAITATGEPAFNRIAVIIVAVLIVAPVLWAIWKKPRVAKR